MSVFIDAKLNYRFVNEKFLRSALRSAHREREDNDFNDGNRGLAHYGNLAIQMVMTYEVIIEKGKTLHDVHIQDHWSKSKKGRAKACKLLGLEPLITRSVRQQHECAPDTVLDHALSAVLGAIYLDCEEQERTPAQIRLTILRILRTIDAILEEDSPMADGRADNFQLQGQQLGTVTDVSEPNYKMVDFGPHDLTDIDKFTFEWFEQEFDDFPAFPLPRQSLEPQPPLGQGGTTASLDRNLVDDIIASVPAPGSELCPARKELDVELRGSTTRHTSQSNEPDHDKRQSPFSMAQATTRDVAKPLEGTKRKRNQNQGVHVHSFYDTMLYEERKKLISVSNVDQETLNRFLEHPLLNNQEIKFSNLFQFLYLAIGSWETIFDFRNLVQLARSVSNVGRKPSFALDNATEVYNEICRLEKEGSLSILLRRYHIVKLCEDEHLYNDYHSRIIVETPSTVGGARVSKPGNPVLALDASLTEKLLRKIMPHVDPGSYEYQKARGKVKRLRKLAGCLRPFVKSYGFGILGLLPSGPSFEHLSVTDNMLLTIPQANFGDFLQLLHQEQGQHLEGLSSFIEPSLAALVTGSLNSDIMCRIEWIDDSFLSKLPKGLMNLGLAPPQPNS